MLEFEFLEFEFLEFEFLEFEFLEFEGRELAACGPRAASRPPLIYNIIKS